MLVQTNEVKQGKERQNRTNSLNFPGVSEGIGNFVACTLGKKKLWR